MKKLFPLLLVLIAACSNNQNPKAASTVQPPPARVPVLPIQTQTFAATVSITGTLVSRSQVDIKAETTGRVVRFPKQEGDSVRAGEQVVWVNDENYKLDVQHAQTAAQVAEAGVERAKIQASYAAAELERANHLIASGGITDKDLKAARVAEQDAKAQVALAQAQLEQARAVLAVSEKRQRDTIIIAPVSGEIQKRHVNPGAYVEPPTPVLTLVDNQRLEIETPIPTSDLAPIRPGQKVTFRVNAYPEVEFDGRVIEVLPAVEAQTRSATVRIAVNNASRRLKTGMFAQGEILTGIQRNAVIIPASAVYRDDRSAKDTYVFVVENGKAARRNVRIGRERNRELEIVEGLSAGEMLVGEQSIEIAEGVRVEARR